MAAFGSVLRKLHGSSPFHLDGLAHRPAGQSPSGSHLDHRRLWFVCFVSPPRLTPMGPAQLMRRGTTACQDPTRWFGTPVADWAIGPGPHVAVENVKDTLKFERRPSNKTSVHRPLITRPRERELWLLGETTPVSHRRSSSATVSSTTISTHCGRRRFRAGHFLVPGWTGPRGDCRPELAAVVSETSGQCRRSYSAHAECAHIAATQRTPLRLVCRLPGVGTPVTKSRAAMRHSASFR